MKLPQYRLLKVSASKKGTSIVAEWVDFVTCGECKYFEPKEDWCYWKDESITADGFCSYGERNCSEKPNNSKERSSE